MITFKIFKTVAEAKLSQSKLESKNIWCVVKIEDQGGVTSVLKPKGGARLIVQSNDLEKANLVLEGVDEPSVA